MASLPWVVRRQLVFVYVDAAFDGGVYRLGLFSLELGSWLAVPLRSCRTNNVRRREPFYGA